MILVYCRSDRRSKEAAQKLLDLGYNNQYEFGGIIDRTGEVITEKKMDFKFVKLEIFIPETHLRDLQIALADVDAGHIGKYDCALSYSKVTSTWRPLAGAKPVINAIPLYRTAQDIF